MEVKAIHYLPEPAIFSADPRVKQRLHMSVTECAIHFRSKQLAKSEMFKNVDYLIIQDVVSAHPGFTIVVTSVPFLSVD